MFPQAYVKRIPKSRRLFVAGKIRPKRAPRPCSSDWHAGPLVDTERFRAAGGIWTDCGNCAVCGSTITRSQLKRSA